MNIIARISLGLIIAILCAHAFDLNDPQFWIVSLLNGVWISFSNIKKEKS